MKPPDEQIPETTAVIPYYVTGTVSLVVFHILLIFALPDILTHYFQPKLLAITHLFVLGWATMIIFGASNQLIPVMAERKLYSEYIPKLNIALLVVAVPGLVYSFWNFQFTTLTYVSSGIIVIAILLHAINVYKTISAGKSNIITDTLLMSHAWLAITCVLGLLLLINLVYPLFPEEHLHYLKIHAPIGMGGWFLQLIIAVSSRLIPMFLLSRKENHKLLNITFYTVNAGLALYLVEGMLFKSAYGALLYIGLIGTGLVAYTLYIRGCYKTALRKNMDAGMKQTFIAIGFMVVAVALLLIATNAPVPTNISTAFGFSFFAGLVSIIIMGQTFKTLPFIVWMHITKPDKLPEIMPKDLYSEKIVWLQMLAYLPGILIFLSGIVLKNNTALYTGAILMLSGCIVYMGHVVSIVYKLKQKHYGD